jgi:hypothetical protein
LFYDVVNAVVGLLGLALTAFTLGRVRAVRRAQRDERALVRQLYGADLAAAQISAAADYLSRSRDAKARELAQYLSWFRGQVDGVSRALDSTIGVQPAVDRKPRLELRDRGYYSPEFLSGIAGSATRKIDLLMYRPMVVSVGTVLDAFQAAAERGIAIRMLALSPEASDEILSQGAALMPAAAVYEPVQLRPQLREAERRVAQHVANWPLAARRRFAYRRYCSMPGPHFVRCDATVYLGFTGFRSGPMPIRFDERVFVEVPVDSKLGGHIEMHFEQVWSESQASAVG